MNNVALGELLERLRACIGDAEHKPGEWASASSQMGGITTAAKKSCKEDPAELLRSLQQQTWAGFSYKRDSWLAVEAVNALPMLMALAEATLAQATAPGDAGDVARALIAGLGASHDDEAAQATSARQGAASTLPTGSAVDAPAGQGADEEGESEGAQLIVAERRRQRCVEGWTAEHDDQHKDRSMAMVCALYAAPVPLFELTGGRTSYSFVDPWPDSWSGEWDKRRRDSRGRPKDKSLDEQVSDLTKAGALAAAEIDRILRLLRRGGHAASRVACS